MTRSAMLARYRELHELLATPETLPRGAAYAPTSVARATLLVEHVQLAKAIANDVAGCT